MNLLAHIFGLDNLSGRWYGFWSGVGGDFGLLAIAGSLMRKHNCHVKWCWRLGRHQVEGTPHVVCRKHHPDDHLTAADITSGGAL